MLQLYSFNPIDQIKLKKIQLGKLNLQDQANQSQVKQIQLNKSNHVKHLRFVKLGWLNQADRVK